MISDVWNVRELSYGRLLADAFNQRCKESDGCKICATSTARRPERPEFCVQGPARSGQRVINLLSKVITEDERYIYGYDEQSRLSRRYKLK
jgi:hypothetical protein